jgi:hypothetical protein
MRAAALLVLAAGCQGPVDEDVFARKFASIDCARHWQCDRGSFELYYFGQLDCVREKERTYQELAAFEEEYGCTYDADAAGEAYAALHDMTCQGWVEGGALLGITNIWAECD